MPGYGLRGPREGSGLLTWAWAEQQLIEARNFWLATHWPDGRPHVMPVWAVWLRDALWFSCSKRSRKSRNLANDPRCVLSTENAASPVVVEGSASLVTEIDDLRVLLEAENAKYSTAYGMDMLDPAANSTFRVQPRWAFALRTDDFTGTPTRWIFPPNS
jgi:Pyridoxamine 5'-phosphate oxidase